MTKAQLSELLSTTATEFRLGHECHANALYQQTLNALVQWIEAATQPQAYTPLLRQLLAAQERSDWLDIADTLEYELAAQVAAEDRA